MRFLVGVDCDGPACVVGDPGKSLSFSRDYAFARAQATREADAAARALFDAGAEKVIIWDNHGLGANLQFDLLDERCEIALGAGFGVCFLRARDGWGSWLDLRFAMLLAPHSAPREKRGGRPLVRTGFGCYPMPPRASYYRHHAILQRGFRAEFL